MNTITIKSQAEWDALPKTFAEWTQLQIISPAAVTIIITMVPDNAHAVLRDNAHAELWDNAHAVLRDNAHAVLRDNAHAVLRGNAFCRLLGSRTVADLGGASIGLIQSPGAIAMRKSPNAHILQAPEPEWTVSGWIEREGVTEVNDEVVVYKRVSREYLTQEGTPNQTEWKPGTTVTHPAWKPETGECGSGKYHGCSRPYFADEFRNAEGDRYVAIRVKTADLYAWPNPSYPHKIAFREGVVLHECDRCYGEEIK